MSIRERIAAGEFENKIPYPGELRSACLKKYHRGDEEAIKLFRTALEEENHTTGHPKADRLWDMAWDNGHSNGLENVVCWYEDLVELIRHIEYQL